MKLTIGAGELSLPENFTFDVESSHPFFSNEGTASIPVTIPGSAKNFMMLGHPENQHRAHRHTREQMAYLNAGSFRKRCKLIAESAGGKSGINISLAFMESELYADLQDRRVRDLFAERYFYMTKTSFYRPVDIYQGLTRDPDAYGNTLYDVAIFPVATDLDSNGNVFIMNSPKPDGTLEDSARTVSIGGESVSVPAGYGISVFLYLWALVDGIFGCAGYKVKSNPFRTDTALQKIVVVNNCADMCCSETYSSSLWTFCYADLVPDITVGELLECLRNIFGAYVAFDQETADIRLIKDDITAEPDESLSAYSRNDDSILYPEQRSLKRSFDTSIENADPAAETMQDLRDLYETVGNASDEEAITGSGLFFVPVLGRYFYKQSPSSQTASLGTNCFEYYRELNLESEEISADNKFLPMIKAGTRYMPYIGNRTHKYINVAKAEKKQEQALQLCYAHFYNKEATETSEAEAWYSGSSYSYLENGRMVTDDSLYPKPYPALTPEGLNSYWRDYETLLVNGAPDIEVTLDIPLEKLMRMNRFAPKIYHGSKVLIKSLSYSINDSGIASAKATLLVLPEYDDSIYIPPAVTFGTAYFWKLVSTKEDNWPKNSSLYIQIPDGLEDYTSSDAPETKPTSAGIITKKRRRWTIFLLTPETFAVTWEEYFISMA